ncbi:MAG: GNAT family N-acetyltransferase [Opitutales bacterium]
MACPLRLETLAGPAAADHVDALGALRIAVFREYPYLYDGDLAYERRYLRHYFGSARSVCVLAWEGQALVGASTGIPLAEAEEAFRAPFRAAGFALEEVFYFGESILLPAHRGRGCGHAFFAAREAWAQREGPFRWTAFCAIERPADDPRRPAGHRPLDGFWRQRGYLPRPDLKARLAWKPVGGEEEVEHTLGFWLRDGSVPQASRR